ncbi:MAG TPA: BTAD domain-containing putative transcriptional regulator, partial [Gemmatimonadales bacterium]|nr:BTAD domain-containing putative transcriptional regulator [Gemmatimonadales bacterium]
MYSLRFLGCVRVEDPVGEAQGSLSQPRALALLACLSAAGRDGCTRDKLLGLFWPDLDSRHARHSLSVQLHQIRRVLGSRAVLTHGDFVRLNPEIVSTDLADFQEAIERGDLERAATMYRGAFLEGFHVTGAAEFERWVDDERQRLAVQCLDVLESLAKRAELAGSPGEAVGWWQRAAQHDPFNSRVALACARALAAAGDRGNGVQFLREHVKQLRADLEIEPDHVLLDAIRTGDFGVAPDYTSGTARSVSEAAASGPSPLAPSTAALPDDQAGTVADHRPDIRPHARHRSFRKRVAVVAVVVVLALTGTMAVRARGVRAPDADRVLVMPTESVGLDTTIATLVSSHLHAALAEWHFLEAVSPSAVTEWWRTA